MKTKILAALVVGFFAFGVAVGCLSASKEKAAPVVPVAAAPNKIPCRVGAYYFGMWSPSAFQVIKGFPFKLPDFYFRAETPVQPLYANDGKHITGYATQGLVPK